MSSVCQHKTKRKRKSERSVRGLRAECYPPKVAIRVRVPADAFLSKGQRSLSLIKKAKKEKGVRKSRREEEGKEGKKCEVSIREESRE